MDEILPIKPQDTPASEQYDPKIREPIEKIETRFENYVIKKLAIINAKVLNHAKALYDQQQATKKAVNVDIKNIFDASDFDFDLNILLPVFEIGIDYQKTKLQEVIDQYDLNPTLKALIGLKLNPNAGSGIIRNLIRQREDQLKDWIYSTTIDKMYIIIERDLAEGIPYENIAYDLKYALGIEDNNRALKIARTETNWALNDGTRTYVKTLGVDKYNISPAANACEECLRMAYENGESGAKTIYDIDNADILPIHPFCRCVLISVIPEEWLAESANTGVSSTVLDLFNKSTQEDVSMAEMKKYMALNKSISEKYVQQITTIKEVLLSELLKTKQDLDLTGEELKDRLNKAIEAIPAPKDGYTPEKGKDYFTDKEINTLIKEVNKLVKIPKKGQDYYTLEEKEELIKTVLSKVPAYEPPEEKTMGEIARGLESLEGEARLSTTALKDFHEVWEREAKNIQLLIRTGVTALAALSDVTLTNLQSGQVLSYNGTAWVNQTVSGTGTVTNVSATDSDDIDFTVNNPTTTPVITGVLKPTTVTAGSYTLTNITVDANGRITAASNGSATGIVPVRVVTGTGSVTLTTADFLVIINKTVGAATTVNLPATPATGLRFSIKDGKGDAQTHNITLVPNAGNIDGAVNQIINANYGTVDIIYNGTEWNIF